MTIQEIPQVPQVMFNLNNLDFYLANDIGKWLKLPNISDSFSKSKLPDIYKIKEEKLISEKKEKLTSEEIKEIKKKINKEKLTQEEIKKIKYKIKYRDLYKSIKEEVISKIDKVIDSTVFLSKEAFQDIWTSRRKDLSEIDHIYEELFGGKVVRYIPIETATISLLKQAFPHLIFNDQYRVEYNGKYYRIDTYIKKYKIAIEVDESQHKQQVEEDFIRQEKIEEKLGCEFIRIKKEDNIIGVIAQINNIIFENDKNLQEENKLLKSKNSKLNDKIKYFKNLIKNMTDKI